MFPLESGVIEPRNYYYAKRIILFIDEVDKSSNNQIFLSFLGMLTNKYLLMQQEEDKTFHSVIFVGIYDIKNLKLKIRQDEEKNIIAHGI